MRVPPVLGAELLALATVEEVLLEEVRVELLEDIRVELVLEVDTADELGLVLVEEVVAVP